MNAIDPRAAAEIERKAYVIACRMEVLSRLFTLWAANEERGSIVTDFGGVNEEAYCPGLQDLMDLTGADAATIAKIAGADGGLFRS